MQKDITEFMKKIAIVSQSYYPNIWNGQGRSTFNTAYGLAKKGHEVTVFTFTNKKQSYQQQDGQVTINYIGGFTSDKDTTLPHNMMGTWSDLVFAQMSKLTLDVILLVNCPGWKAAKDYRSLHSNTKIISFVPFLYTFTGWLQPLDPALENEIKCREQEFIVESDVLISHTERFGKKLAIHANREINLIPNCHLDLSSSEESLPVTEVKNQLCFVGRANREKSLERIIRVLPELPEVSLIVASPKSSPDYLTSLINLAKKFDVEHRIEFVGWKPTKEIRQLYKSSELAIVTSQFEPFGYSCLDPMALGTPVIVSEWSCLEEYLGSKENVFTSLPVLVSKIEQILKFTKQQKLESQAVNKELIETVLSEEYISSALESLL